MILYYLSKFHFIVIKSIIVISPAPPQAQPPSKKPSPKGVIRAKESKKESCNEKQRSSVRSDEFATKFAYVICFGACSVDNIYRGVLDNRVNLDTCGQASSSRIRYLWTHKFSNPQQKILRNQMYLYQMHV